MRNPSLHADVPHAWAAPRAAARRLPCIVGRQRSRQPSMSAQKAGGFPARLNRQSAEVVSLEFDVSTR